MHNREEELELLLEDDEALDVLVGETPSVTHVNRMKDDLVRENAAIARESCLCGGASWPCTYTRRIERIIDGGKEEGEVYEESIELRKILDAAREHLADVDGQVQMVDSAYTRESVGAELRDLAREAEGEADRCLQGFMEGDDKVDAFVTEYVRLREEYHRREILAENILHSGRH
jgi:hypothetical protein